jgi:hypothetical protein
MIRLFRVLVAAAAATLTRWRTAGVASARRLRTRNAEAPPEGPLLQGIRVDAAFRVGMPCAREGRRPLRKTKMKTGVWAERSGDHPPIAERKNAPEERQHGAAPWRDARRVPPRDRNLRHPQERQHSAPSSAKSGTECLRRGAPNPLARRIVTEGRDPASRLFQDLRGSVSAANRARPAKPDACAKLTDSVLGWTFAT